MNYLSDIDLDSPAQDALSQAAQQRLSTPKPASSGKSQAVGGVGGTILGAILGSMAGAPMQGAALGGQLGSAVGGMVDPANRRNPQGGVDALSKADALWQMWSKRKKDPLLDIADNPGVATGGFGLPASDLATSMMA